MARGGKIAPMEPMGLRERKKVKTRRAIQTAALDLIERQGYEATTVEQIAAAAEVSPSTFFRYFPTKEDAILQDEYDPMMATLIAEQPADLTPIEAVRHGLRTALGAALGGDRERVLQRTRMAFAVPAVRARTLDSMRTTEEILAQALAQRTGRPSDDFELKALAGAIVGALLVAMEHWAASDGHVDLGEVTDQALQAVANAGRAGA